MNHGALTTKGYLSQAFHLDKDVQIKLMQVQAYRELAMRTTAAISDMPRSESRNLQPMANLVEKVVDKEREIDEAVDALIDLKTEIEGRIALMETPDFRRVLELRYLCFLSWEEVGDLLGYSDRHARRVHGMALKEFEKHVRPCPCMSGSDMQVCCHR